MGNTTTLEEWFELKRKLRETPRDVPFVSEGDVWWISFGENVGTEMSGKNRSFSRPGVVIKKLSGQFFFVIPSTTIPRTGSWYHPIHHMDTDMFLCLHQARSVDYRRLRSRMGSLDASTMAGVREAFWKLFG